MTLSAHLYHSKIFIDLPGLVCSFSLLKQIMNSIHIHDSEEAVEYDDLNTFFRLSETWNVKEDSLMAEPKLPEAKPIGVPGAMMPLQMTPDRLKEKITAQPPKSPLSGAGGKKSIPVNKRAGERDLGDELRGYGLQGVKVTDDELLDLVKDLGLDDDAAGGLVRDLSGTESKVSKEKKLQEPSVQAEEEETKECKRPEEKKGESTNSS